jgi:hypothetical protein
MAKEIKDKPRTINKTKSKIAEPERLKRLALTTNMLFFIFKLLRIVKKIAIKKGLQMQSFNYFLEVGTT